MKPVFAPHLNRHVLLGGRVPRPVWGPHLKLGSYFRGASLPSSPASCSYSSAATASLVNVYCNDRLGCCVIAGANHVQGVETGNADGGTPVVVTDDQIVKEYSSVGGYVNGDPATDQGCDEQTAWDYYCKVGWGNGTKADGYLAVDATNQAEVQAAIYLFEHVIYGVSLPDAWVNPFPSGNGFTWDVNGNPDPSNGHCFIACGYDSVGTEIDTWGLLGKLTWKANATYAVNSASGGMLWVLLSPDEISKAQAKAPNGLAWADLISDWNAMGGSANVSPNANPPPPSASPTLAQAQGWIAASMGNSFPVLTRGQAISQAQAALAKNWTGS